MRGDGRGTVQSESDSLAKPASAVFLQHCNKMDSEQENRNDSKRNSE